MAQVIPAPSSVSNYSPSRRFRGGFFTEMDSNVEFEVLNKPFANLREGRL